MADWGGERLDRLADGCRDPAGLPAVEPVPWDEVLSLARASSTGGLHLTWKGVCSIIYAGSPLARLAHVQCCARGSDVQSPGAKRALTSNRADR